MCQGRGPPTAPHTEGGLSCHPEPGQGPAPAGGVPAARRVLERVPRRPRPRLVTCDLPLPTLGEPASGSKASVHRRARRLSAEGVKADSACPGPTCCCTEFTRSPDSQRRGRAAPRPRGDRLGPIVNPSHPPAPFPPGLPLLPLLSHPPSEPRAAGQRPPAPSSLGGLPGRLGADPGR